MTERPLFIYLESPPLHEDVAAHGLYRAGTPILNAIENRIASIALYPMDRRYGLEKVAPPLRRLCRRLPRLFTLFRALRKRVFRDDFENGLVSAVVGGWAQRSEATQIFALEGSDPEVLARVDAIATRAGKPFSVYMVDDYAWTMRLTGKTESEVAATGARVAKILARARHVFAITEPLGTLLLEQFGVRSTTLHLAFEPKARLRPPIKDQIFFLGSVNFLYVDGLKTLIALVAKLRTETGRDLSIRLTTNGELSELPAFVRVAPINSAAALAEEIAASLFAFLPYSFDPKLRTMVMTSFPSKSMECLAYARSIVVYAPAYSTSSRLFIQETLPTVADSPEHLEQAIRDHLSTQPNHSTLYRDYLRRYHSPDAVRRTILDALGIGDV